MIYDDSNSRLIYEGTSFEDAADAILADALKDFSISNPIKSGFTSGMTILESMIEGVRQGMSMDIWEQLQGYKYSMYNVKYGERRKYWKQAEETVKQEQS